MTRCSVLDDLDLNTPLDVVLDKPTSQIAERPRESGERTRSILDSLDLDSPLGLKPDAIADSENPSGSVLDSLDLDGYPEDYDEIVAWFGEYAGPKPEPGTELPPEIAKFTF